MVDPPPTATQASNPPSVAKVIASRNETSVGSTRTRSNSEWLIRLSRRLWRTVSTGCSFARRASVRTITFWTRISARSIPISRVTPRPNRMLEAAISNAYSSAMCPPGSERCSLVSGRLYSPVGTRTPPDDRVPAWGRAPGTLALRGNDSHPPGTEEIRHAEAENCGKGEGGPQGRKEPDDRGGRIRSRGDGPHS